MHDVEQTPNKILMHPHISIWLEYAACYLIRTRHKLELNSLRYSFHEPKQQHSTKLLLSSQQKTSLSPNFPYLRRTPPQTLFYFLSPLHLECRVRSGRTAYWYERATHMGGHHRLACFPSPPHRTVRATFTAHGSPLVA